MLKIRQKRIKLKFSNSKYHKELIAKQFRMPNRQIETFITSNEPSSVIVFNLTTDHKVYLVRQFRPGLEEHALELPGGCLEPNEDITEAAKRELLEETGLKAESVIHLSSINYGPYSSGMKHMCIALNCVDTQQLNLDDNEFLTVEKYSLEEVREMIKTGKIRGFETVYMGLDYLKELNFFF